MLTTKYFVATIGLAALTVAMTIGAQPPGGPRGPGGPGGPGGIGGDIERLTILLDLDAYQKTEVQRLLEEQRAAFAAERRAAADAAGTQPSFEDMRARREQAREDTLTKLESVLTEVQITKFKILTERPEPPRGRPGRPPDAE